MIILLNYGNDGVIKFMWFELCGHGCDVTIACVLFIVVCLIAK